VVMLDVTVDQPTGILEGERSAGPQALSFERLVPALDLTVGQACQLRRMATMPIPTLK
jgi:hypothetical protein